MIKAEKTGSDRNVPKINVEDADSKKENATGSSTGRRPTAFSLESSQAGSEENAKSPFLVGKLKKLTAKQKEKIRFF